MPLLFSELTRKIFYSVLLLYLIVGLGVVVGQQSKDSSVNSITWGQQGNGTPMTTRDLKPYGIEVLGPGHPEFELEADKILSNKDRQFASAIRKVSVVIRNMANKTVVGYALRWNFTDSSGKSTSQKAAYSQPGALFDGGRAKFPHSLPGGILIPPGNRRLASPFATVGSDDSPRYTLHAELKSQVGMFADLLRQSSQVSVNLDSVLFEDGTFAGPDELGSLKTFIARFDAGQEFYKRVLALVEEGTSESEILKWVKTQELADFNTADQKAFEVHVNANEFLTVTSKFDLSTAIRLAKSKFYSQRPKFVPIDQRQ